MTTDSSRPRTRADLLGETSTLTGGVVEALFVHRREAFAPVVEAMDSEDAEPRGHRYFGRPWMPQGMEWPVHGGENLEFVLQLRAADLPGPTRELLGGWESWEQGVERPRDRDGQPMTFVYQVGFEGLLRDRAESVDSPTWGTGQIHFSQGTGELYYSWACD